MGTSRPTQITPNADNMKITDQDRAYGTEHRTNRVLLADPVADAARYMKFVLEKRLNCKVEAFATTEEFLEAFAPGEDKWVFCERTTPALRSGLLVEIRRLDPFIPFFVHTASGSEQLVAEAKIASANGWIEKPSDPHQLIDSLRRFDHQTIGGQSPYFLHIPWRDTG